MIISKQFMIRMNDDIYRDLNRDCVTQLDVLYYMLWRHGRIESTLFRELQNDTSNDSL